MNAKLRLAACLLAVVAVMSTGCTSLLGGTPTPAVTAPKPGGASTGASSTATPTPSAAATPVVQDTFAAEPKPKTADPILTAGDWGYHASVDWDDSGSGKQINITAEQNERYKLIKEQYKKLLDTLKDSTGTKKLVSAAGGDTDEIKWSVVTIDAMDLVAPHTPWVTATLRATFPTEDGLKAVDVFVYRAKTAKGLNNTPYVSGTSVGYVDTDGSIRNPTHPNFPR